MNIRTKLLVYIGGVLAILLAALFTLLIFLSYDDIKKDLDIQIDSQTASIEKQVSDLITTSARSYMAGIGNSVLQIASDYVKNNSITDRDLAVKNFYSQLTNIQFLKTGNIFLTDSKGIIIAHPNSKLVNTISPMLSWLQRLKPDEKKYKAYEEDLKNKLVYRVYDQNMDINICISVFTSEFINSLDLSELNKTMNTIKIGKSGYPFLLKSDGTIITHPNIDYFKLNGRDILNRIISEKNGYETYSWTEPDGITRDKYVNFRENDESGLIVAVTGYIDEAYQTLYSQVRLIIIIGLTVILVVFILITIVSRGVTKPLGIFTNSLLEISKGEGDLTNRIKIASSDEVGVMGKNFNNFLENLQKMINSIKKSSNHSLDIKNRILSDVKQTEESVTIINNNLVQIKGNTDVLHKNVDFSKNFVYSIGDNIEQLNSTFEEQIRLFDSTSAQFQKMVESTMRIFEVSNLKQESTQELIKRTKEGDIVINKTQEAVKEVVSLLDSIKGMANIISHLSTQTNLLSINAAIEAAHAGEFGKGFAVVASEINKLAMSSSKNSSEISNTIKEIESTMKEADTLSRETSRSFNLLQKEISDIVDTFDTINRSNAELVNITTSVTESINTLTNHSHIVKNKVNSISEESVVVKESIENTQLATTRLIGAIEDINTGVEIISNSLTEHIKTTEELELNSNDLAVHINRFKS